MVCERPSYPHAGQSDHVPTSRECPGPERSRSALGGHDHGEWPHRNMGKSAGYRRAIHEEGAMACQRRKEGFRTDSKTENLIGRPSTEGSGDYDRDGNQCIYSGAAIEGDGESEDRDGEEVG